MGVKIGVQKNGTTATISKIQPFDWGAFITNASALPDLARLEIHNCPTLIDFKDISKLTQLKELHISGCENVEDLQRLQGHRSLEIIHFDHCDNLRAVNGIDGLPRLRLLEFHRCLNLSSLTGVKNLPQIEELWLPDTPFTTRGLRPISNLLSLTTLDISSHSGSEVLDLDFLARLSKLELLDVSGCAQVTEVAVLKRLPNLSILRLAGTGITSGKDISGCKKLSYLVSQPSHRT